MPSLSDITDLTIEPHNQHTMDEAMPTRLDQTASQQVGKPVNRVHADLKVSGQATFAAEYDIDNQLYGVLVGATIAKGEVSQIHTEEALKIPGVVDVIIDLDTFIRNPAQGGQKTAPAQGVKKIAYQGQPIAVVVAETFEAASEAAKAVQVQYISDNQEGAFDFDNEKSNAAMIDGVPVSKQGNPEKTLEEAEVMVDRTYHTPSQSHAAMEPHASIATWDGDEVTIYTSNQMLAPCQQQMADVLGINPDKVRLVSRFIGGGFGGKLGIAPEAVAAAIAAKKLRRPVQVVMARTQVMEATARRSNTEQRVALGADKDGKIHTIIHDSIVTNLPGETFYEPVAESTPFIYDAENRQIKYQMVRMNQVLAGSMRAPGEAVGQIAIECAMDELAVKLNMDPIELRVLNEPEQDPSKKIPFSTRQLIGCMRTGAEKFGWDQRRSQPASVREGDWLIGIGMAAASRVNNLKPSQARATLKLNESKLLGVEAIIETDMTDIGTGTYTILAQIAADMLGLPIDHVSVKLGDTDLPPASGSGGSVGAASSGSSVYLACEKLRELIGKQVGLDAETVQLDNGIVIRQSPSSKRDQWTNQTSNSCDAQSDSNSNSNSNSNSDGGDKNASKLEAITSALQHTAKSAQEVVTGMAEKITETATKTITEKLVESVADKAGIPLEQGNKDFGEDEQRPLRDVIAQCQDNQLKALGEIKPGATQKKFRQACYGANFVEVGVHAYTGEIRLRRMTGVFTAGRILNHKTATSQCYGGMVFGIGSALMEALVHDTRDGRLCNHDLAEYLVPVNADVPQLDVILLDEDDQYTNPIHIKGIGETAISGAAAAIANAVYNATGIRVYDFPIKLDDLLDQLPDSHHSPSIQPNQPAANASEFS